MRFSAPFIKRPIATTFLALGVMLAGLICFRLLPVAAVPNIPLPAFVVFVSEPGANPQTMASTVAAPLERELGQIPGLTQMTSVNSTGSSSVILLFSTDTRATSDAYAIQAAINAALPDLPTNLPNRPYYKQFNPASRPILTMALTSKTETLGAIYNVADTLLVQRLSQVSGVAQVLLNGAQSPAVRIALWPRALARAGLTSADVFNAVRGANDLAPLGEFRGPHTDHILAINGQLHNARGYRRIVLKSAGSSVISLADVASVTNSVANTQLAAWDGTKPAILVTITKTPKANVIATVNHIKTRLPEIRAWLPHDIRLSILTDRTTTIRASIVDIEITLLITIILVLAVVLAFMGRLAPTLAAGVTVPLSIAGTLAGMWACGFSLDNFSLLALTISIGFVVDDAIVMIENIVTYLDHGASPLEAALKGAQEIGFTVVSITLSLIAVFVPLTLMPGVVGQLFHEFAVTLTLAISLSALVSLTVTPMICGHLLRPSREGPPSAPIFRFFDRGYTQSLALYTKSLDWALAHRTTMLVLTLFTVVLTVGLYIRIPKSFLPEEDTGLIIGNTVAASNVSFTRMKTLQGQVVRVLKKDPAVATVSSSVGVVNGFSTPNRGKLFIGLKPRAKRSLSAQAVIAHLRPQLARILGMKTFLQVAQDIFIGGRAANGQYQFSVLDPSLQSLGSVTALIERRIATLPGLRDVSSDQDKPEPQISVVIDRAACARLGVSVAAVDTALNNAYAQRQISRIYAARNQYEVILKTRRSLSVAPRDLQELYVAGSTGPVLLSAIAHFTRTATPLSVRHDDQIPAATISFNLARGTALGPAITEIKEAVAGLALPQSARIKFGSNAKYFLQSMAAEPLLILAAIAAIYIVLGVLYESLTQPLTILSTLPSAGVGALLALTLSGIPLSVIAIIGIFLLMGIVKKNGIMLVDFALGAERRLAYTPEQAIRAACLQRFRPIMMTTLAAILGAVPLALSFGTGHHLRQPIGVAVIVGLIVSQALTLYTTPIVYLALSGRGRKT